MWITKYRKPAITGKIAESTRELTRQVCQRNDVEILAGHVSKDHIHLINVFCRWNNKYVWWQIWKVIYWWRSYRDTVFFGDPDAKTNNFVTNTHKEDIFSGIDLPYKCFNYPTSYRRKKETYSTIQKFNLKQISNAAIKKFIQRYKVENTYTVFLDQYLNKFDKAPDEKADKITPIIFL